VESLLLLLLLLLLQWLLWSALPFKALGWKATG
jgi:hypothetical protein